MMWNREFVDWLQGVLPIFVVSTPVLASPLIFFVGRRSEKARDFLGIFITALVMAMVLLMYPQAMDGGIKIYVEKVLGGRIIFKVDMLSYIMALMTSFVWFFASIYAFGYMFHEKHRTRFYAFMMLTLGGTLGTVMAGDLLSLFIFFEIMSFSAYVLVAHTQTKEAMEAGFNYIYLATFGGLCLLMGVLLYSSATGTMEILPMADVLNQLGFSKYVMFFLFLLGFGIKAGVIPLHIWLPKAHPVAPTPASALLSGVMIKIGAYGILRVSTHMYFQSTNTYFEGESQRIIWPLSTGIGYFLIWLGIVTMVVGVFMALQQSHAKKMLAYHSISQMGYIVMGIGVATYLGSYGVMGYSGAIYHMVNHALFKSALFLVVGAVYLKTGEYDMYKMGGLWRKMPFAALVCLIASLGITGFPFFNGFVSKTMLHHAIFEAIKYGSPSLRFAEIAFTIVSAGTVASFIKLFGFTFVGKLPEKFKDIKGESIPLSIGMGGLALAIFLIGIFPRYLLDNAILQASQWMSFEPTFTKKVMEGLNFFAWYELRTIFLAYILGFILFIFGIKFHFFHLRFPKWLSVEEVIYRPVAKGFSYFCKDVCGTFDKVIDEPYVSLDRPTEELAKNGSESNRKDSYKRQATSSSGQNAFSMMNLDNDFMIFASLLVIVIIVLFLA
jgi:hydrogenase-4 component B